MSVHPQRYGVGISLQKYHYNFLPCLESTLVVCSACFLLGIGDSVKVAYLWQASKFVCALQLLTRKEAFKKHSKIWAQTVTKKGEIFGYEWSTIILQEAILGNWITNVFCCSCINLQGQSWIFTLALSMMAVNMPLKFCSKTFKIQSKVLPYILK